MSIFPVLALTFLAIGSASAHYDTAYFRSASDPFVERENWMSEIPDKVRLNLMAIPGAHAADAYDTTHCLDCNQQLRYGIRFLELDVHHIKNQFFLENGIKPTIGETWLPCIIRFLQRNPSETVLVKMNVVNQGEGNTRSILDTFKDVVGGPVAEVYLQTNDKRITIGQARGKLIFFSTAVELQYNAIRYSAAEIQPDMEISSPIQKTLYPRWETIKAHLFKATYQGDTNKFYFNFLTAYNKKISRFEPVSGHKTAGTSGKRTLCGPTPIGWPDMADFPRIDCGKTACKIYLEGTNILTRDFIKKFNEAGDQERTVGVIMTDFPGTGLIEEIIKNNYVFPITA